MQPNFWQWTGEDEQRLRFYQQFIQPGDLVYDVGANVGNRTKVFLKLRAKVVAFEPQQDCADYLEKIERLLKKQQNFTLVKKALGRSEGEGTMRLGQASVLSTLSEEWIERVNQSGRFSQHQWQANQPVQIITLDQAMQQFGRPTFIKVDVEGYEYEVLSGLSTPVNYISIEFAAENIQSTLNCIDYIHSLSPDVVFQISLAESMQFDFTSWVSAQQVKQSLADLVSRDRLAWGDVYMRC